MGEQYIDPFSMNYMGLPPNFRSGSQYTSMSSQDIMKAKIFQMQQDFYRQLLAANSTPARSAQYQKQGGSRNVELYKTALCDYWCAGIPCRFGNRCWFAHGPEELRIAQFVLPVGYPYNNSSFDYALHKEIQPCGALLNGLGTSPPVGDSFSKVVGYERKEKRLQNSAWTGPVAVSSGGTADSGFSAGRRSSSDSLSSSEMSSISPPMWLGSLDSSEENTCRSCSSTENVWQDAPQQREMGCSVWGDSEKTLLGTAITSNGGNNTREEKNSSVDGEICDLYRWCGFCTMEDSCPFIHRHR